MAEKTILPATYCCNPFNKENHQSITKGLSPVTKWMCNLLHKIEKSMKICYICRKQLYLEKEKGIESEHNLVPKFCNEILSNKNCGLQEPNATTTKLEYDVQKICRICLKDGLNMMSINDGYLRDLFTKFTKLEVSKDDNLPNKLCTSCIEKLNNSQNFHELCIQSDYILRQQRVIKVEPLEITDLCETNYSSEEDEIENKLLSKKETMEEKNKENNIKKVKNLSQTNSEEICNSEMKRKCYKSKNTKKLKIVKKNKTTILDYNLYLKCPKCKKGFSDSEILNRHFKKHLGTKRNICKICGREFSFSQNLKSHEMTHTGIKRSVCYICGGSFNYLKSHITNKHSDVKPFTCKFCPKKFKQTSALREHLLRHSGVKKFTCSLCRHTTLTKGDLKKHMAASHTAVKKFLCQTCPKGFNKATDLLVHTRIHTGERPYNCEVCPMSFRAASVLKNHMITHSGQKSHHCGTCGKAFARKYRLAAHEKVHT